MSLLLNQELEHLLAPPMLSRSLGGTRSSSTAHVRHLSSDEPRESEESSLSAGTAFARPFSASRDESRLEDDGEVGSRHEICRGRTDEDGEKVEEVEEEVTRRRREEGDEVLVGGYCFCFGQVAFCD